VAAKAEELGGRVVLVDAQRLSQSDFRADDCGAALYDQDEGLIELNRGRGWLRRLAPEDWRDNVLPDRFEGVVRQAWLTAMATLIELAGVEWLSPLRGVFASEEKLVQQRACRSIGVRFVPAVLVTKPTRIPSGFGPALVVKPLAAGHYRDDTGAAHVVHATAMMRDDERLELLAGAPFLVQPRVVAARHLRVVTVLDSSWVAALDASDLPLDWRASTEAHSSFEPASHPDVAADAVRLARALGVGYSSQDWLVDASGEAHFLDLNPAGQWLFLPDEVSDAVTEAIGSWVVGK
jgi:hypothetical protein